MSRVAFVLVAAMCLVGASAAAYAAPLRIVAIGASNTHGWYVGNAGAYPAQLQALQIRQQLGTQALSLANQAPQTLLSLFK